MIATDLADTTDQYFHHRFARVERVYVEMNNGRNSHFFKLKTVIHDHHHQRESKCLVILQETDIGYHEEHDHTDDDHHRKFRVVGADSNHCTLFEKIVTCYSKTRNLCYTTFLLSELIAMAVID